MATTQQMRYVRNILTALGCLVTIFLLIMGFRKGIFTSEALMKEFLYSFGLWAPVIFILLQVIQVVVPILPGAVGCAVGVLAFGPVFGFIYNYIGICIGSILAFLITRYYGSSLLSTLTSQKTWDKYSRWMEKSQPVFDRLFTVAIVLPVAPDDFLCYLAGGTKMKLKKFIAIILLGKPLSIAAYSLMLMTMWQWICAAMGNIIS